MAKAIPLLGAMVGPAVAGAAGISMSPIIASALGGAAMGALGGSLDGQGAGKGALGGLLSGGLMGGLGGGGLGNLFGGGANAATGASALASQAPSALSGAGSVAAQGAAGALAGLPGGVAGTAAGLPAGLAAPGVDTALAQGALPAAQNLTAGLPVGQGALTAPQSFANLTGLDQATVNSLGSPTGAAFAGGNAMGGLGSFMTQHPLMTMLGLGALASGLGGSSSSTPKVPSLGKANLTPYQQRSYNPTPPGFVPGVSPEWNYFTPANNFATGGPVMPQQSGQAYPGMGAIQPNRGPMIATALGLSPQQVMAQQMQLRQLQPVLGYAMGGRINVPIPSPGAGMHMNNMPMGPSIDNRGLSFLNRAVMREAMPYPGQVKAPMMPKVGAMHPAVSGKVGIPIGMADGGLTPDMGDGSSDSTPAMIDDSQPAALSSGEFIVPSDAVAHLGNGSTMAGSRALQGMVNKVRMQKAGHTSLPKRINPMKMMPS